MKYLQLPALVVSTALFAGCTDLEESSSSGSSSGSSSSGSVLSYGDYTHYYSCPASGSTSAPIPPTVSSSCESVYEDYAELSCNDFTQSYYDSMNSAYYSCLQQEITACYSASSTDPNCY